MIFVALAQFRVMLAYEFVHGECFLLGQYFFNSVFVVKYLGKFVAGLFADLLMNDIGVAAMIRTSERFGFLVQTDLAGVKNRLFSLY